MAKFKVGDVAALFPAPKEPTTEAGKKLQSLFKEFHNPHAQTYQNTEKKKKNVEKRSEETDNQSMFKKNKKRKFSADTNPASTIEESNTKKFKATSEQGDAKFAKKSETKKNNFLAEQNFPRKKNSSKIKEMSFDYSGFKKFETEETFADNNQGSNATFKSKNKSKDKKNASGFIKKSKQQKLAIRNDTVKRQDNEILSNEEAFDSDASFKGEVEEFLKKNASGFIKKSKKQKLAITNGSVKSQDNEILSNEEAFNSGALFKGETGKFITKNAKKLKKKRNNDDNFVQTSQFNTIADDSIKSQVSEKCEEISNKQSFNNTDTSFKNEVKDFVRSAKKLKEKNSGDNVVKNSQPKIPEGGLDFVKLPSLKSEDDEDKLKRTLFVGNLPVNTTKRALGKLFTPFGEIQEIRYHGVETDKAKIFSEDGSKILNPNNYAADSVPGFIVFKDRQSAIFALSLSGSLFKDHHITVDFALPSGTKKLYDDKRSIFIGNLPFGCKDESVWEAFSECGRIESVRIVRDRQTGIGKGFGYVQFSTVEAKENALALEDLTIEGRSIRIKVVESNKTKQNKTDNTSPVKRNTFKSQAIRFKKKNKDSGSRKSVKKIMKKQKNLHQKKKIANMLQKSMKS